MVKPSNHQFEQWYRHYVSQKIPSRDDADGSYEEYEQIKKAYFSGYANGWNDKEKAK